MIALSRLASASLACAPELAAGIDAHGLDARLFRQSGEVQSVVNQEQPISPLHARIHSLRSVASVEEDHIAGPDQDRRIGFQFGAG